MDRVEINQEILLLRGAFSALEYLHLKCDGSDAKGIRQAALIVARTVREIERMNLKKTKLEINETLHFALLCKTIFSNCSFCEQLDQYAALRESSLTALPYSVTWPLYFECVRVSKWTQFLENSLRKFIPLIIHYVCENALSFADTCPFDTQLFTFVCSIYRSVCFEGIEPLIVSCEEILLKHREVPLSDSVATTTLTFKMVCFIVSKLLNGVLTEEDSRRYSRKLRFWGTFAREILKDIALSVYENREVKAAANECHQLVSGFLEDTDIGEDVEEQLEYLLEFLESTGVEFDEKSARYLRDVRTRNKFWIGSLQKLLEIKYEFAESELENLEVGVEDALMLSKTNNKLVDKIIGNSMRRWSLRDNDKFIQKFHGKHAKLNFPSDECESVLTTFFNRLSSCQKIDLEIQRTFCEACFVNPDFAVEKLLRFALDSANEQPVTWLLTNFPRVCGMKYEENFSLLGKAWENIVTDPELTDNQENNLLSVLSCVIKVAERDFLKEFLENVLLKQDPENPNKRMLNVIPVFLTEMTNGTETRDFNKVCVIFHFCQFLDRNLRLNPRELNAKTFEDKEAVVKLIRHLTTNSDTVEDRDIFWLQRELWQLDPRVSYYLDGFFTRTTNHKPDLSRLSLTSLVNFSCYGQNFLEALNQIKSRLSLLQNPYWELTVSVCQVVPTLIEPEWKRLVALLSTCFQQIPNLSRDSSNTLPKKDIKISVFGFLVDVVLTITNPEVLTRECCVNVMQNFSCCTQGLISDLNEDVEVYLEVARLMVQVTDYLKPSAKATVLELTRKLAHRSESLQEIVETISGVLDPEDAQDVLKVLTQR